MTIQLQVQLTTHPYGGLFQKYATKWNNIRWEYLKKKRLNMAPGKSVSSSDFNQDNESETESLTSPVTAISQPPVSKARFYG